MKVGAVLLAAGGARRMGEDKLLADLGGRPLALHAHDAIVAAGLGPPIVAVAPGSGAERLFEGRAPIVGVCDHALGMGHSIAAAIAGVPAGWDAALIALADMPFVRPATIRALARMASPAAIVRPVHARTPGHPVLWGRHHFTALEGLTGDRGGRSILAACPPSLLECDDPGVTIDVDTPEALATARARWSRRSM